VSTPEVVKDELASIFADIEALEKFLGPERSWVCPWKPNPQQEKFLNLTCYEALYGGAAGGGKTGALLMAAAQYIHVPGYSALVLRRTYVELLGADAPVAQARRLFEDLLVSGQMKWVKSEMRLETAWGSEIRFGHIATPGDEIQYQGQALQFVGFDELTHFEEDMYLYLFSRMRAGGGLATHVPLRVRGATNPGGIGHDWVGKRFGIESDGTQNPAKAIGKNGKLRVFVRARLEDNSANLDVEAYDMGLSELGSTRRSQLRDGHWIRDGTGIVYSGFHRKVNLTRRFDREAGPWRYVIAVDLGTSQSEPTTAIVVLAYHEHKPTVVVVQSEAHAGMIPSTIADRLQELMEDFEVERVIVDEGGLGKGYTGEFNLRFGQIAEGAQKRDKLGFRSLVNGAFENGELLIVGWESEGDIHGPNAKLVSELETLPWDEKGLDCPKGAADHYSDALLYGWRATASYAAEAGKPPAPPHGSLAWAAEEEQRMEEAASAEGPETPWWEGGDE
jgi:hypothetical protein